MKKLTDGERAFASLSIPALIVITAGMMAADKAWGKHWSFGFGLFMVLVFAVIVSVHEYLVKKAKEKLQTRIIELEKQIRESDPVYKVARMVNDSIQK
jgi:hypothetical protein